MKKYAVGLLLLAAGCGWVLHPVDPLDRMGGGYKPTPEILVRLSKTPQLCADHTVNEAPYGSITIIANLVALPPGPIRMTLNGQHTADFYGDAATWRLENVGLGQHIVVVEAAGKQVERTFSVWVCGGK